MKNKNAWLVAALTLILFLLVAALVDLMLGLAGGQRIALWVGFVVLGLIAAVLGFFYFRGRSKPLAKKARPDDVVDGAFTAARNRLKQGRKGALTERPVVLVIGSPGSAKSSLVVHSGLDPELLAGEVRRGEAVIPTEGLNLWLADTAILAEVPTPLAEQPERWARVLSRLRPSRLGSALRGNRQAPRAAVVCIGCDELVKPGAGQETVATARRLRERLLEAAGDFGVRLPVYVLFTKADRIPFFADFVRSLSRDEAQQPVGSTLPLAPAGPEGARAEREAERVRGAMGGLIRSLASHRLDVLSREHQEEVRSGAYEYPRELQKISELMTQVMLELTRPSQLSVSPFLRGFYLTGVRPTYVQDGGAPEPAAGPQVALGATSVFNAAALRAQAEGRPAAGATRKVPEWVFVRRLFREVLFDDRVAKTVTAGGSRVDGLRRGLAGAAALLGLILAIGFTVSYFNNRSDLAVATASAQGAEGMELEEPGLPTAEALARLDSIRAVASPLRTHEVEGRPLSRQWGLYTGDDALEELRRLYFDRFDYLLWDRTNQELITALDSLPQTPQETSEYGDTYDALKAYLVTTTNPEYSTGDFLGPVLVRFWPGRVVALPEHTELARSQFAFFGDELPFGNPLPSEPSPSLVDRTRAYLARFAGVDALYQAVVSGASRESQDIRFAEAFPGSESVVRNPYTVPAAFTQGGWTYVQRSLENVDSLFARESWVVGQRTVPPEERTRLSREVGQRYVLDYANHWREFLRQGEVVSYGGPQDAASKLERLSSNQSPLLQMLSLASLNTGVDSVALGRAFQPLHLVMPPAITDRYVNEANQGYLGSLVGLQSAMGQVASATGAARTDALAQANANAEQVRVQVRQLAQGFQVDGDASLVGQSLERLMQAPIGGVESLVRGIPSGEANQNGANFCRTVSPVFAKYPFNATAVTDASMDEVAQALQPGGSALWSFYEGALQGLLVQQGTRYAPRIGATPQPNPAFVAFFNLAADVSRGLFDANGAGPAMAFVFRPQTSAELPQVNVEIDGQRQTFTRTLAAAKTFEWNGATARSARITATTPTGTITIAEAPEGPWALFRLLQQAQWESAGSGRYRLTWPATGSQPALSADLTLSGAPTPMPGYLSQLTCVSQLVR